MGQVPGGIADTDRPLPVARKQRNLLLKLYELTHRRSHPCPSLLLAGTTSICRVPIASRAGHQALNADVKTGCVSCASTDGQNGNPIWCGSPPLSQPQLSLVPPASYAHPSLNFIGLTTACGGFQRVVFCRWNTPIDKNQLTTKKRKADDEEIDDDVKKRLAALRGGGPD